MIVGAVAIAVATSLAIVATRGVSIVEKNLVQIGRRPAGGRAGSPDGALVARAAGAITGALCGCVAGQLLGLGLLPIPVSAFAGWVAMSSLRERRLASRVRDGDRAVVTLVEWLHALASSGRPLETAIARIGPIGSEGSALDHALSCVRRDYALGVPIHDALARAGRESGLRGLGLLAERAERTRELGRAALPMLEDLRDDLRAAERARTLEAASQVEGKLTLVLTLCYLPALALLVIIPLFLTLLTGLFG